MAPAPTTQMRMDVSSDAVVMLGRSRYRRLLPVYSEVGDDALADLDEGGVAFGVIQPSRRTGRSPAADLEVAE